MLCPDGTIRNQALNYCFTSGNIDGTGLLYSVACDIFGNYQRQKWTFGRNKTFIDNAGMN
jgi:hypothetical protein